MARMNKAGKMRRARLAWFVRAAVALAAIGAGLGAGGCGQNVATNGADQARSGNDRGADDRTPVRESWGEAGAGRPRGGERSGVGGNAGNVGAGPAFGDRYDLERDEERGGHTVKKHVGRTDDQLRERLERERNISAASTWTDLNAAETTVAAGLRAERGKVESWERRGERRPNLALHFNAGHVVGRSLRRGAGQVVDVTSAVIVLRADGDGFYVLTTYPEEGRDE